MEYRRKREKVIHIVPRTANYLRFLAFLVSGSYAPVVLMSCLLRYTNLQKNIREQFPSDGVLCIFVVFRVVLLVHGQHKCANVQMHKYIAKIRYITIRHDGPPILWSVGLP